MFTGNFEIEAKKMKTEIIFEEKKIKTEIIRDGKESQIKNEDIFDLTCDDDEDDCITIL